MNTKLNVSQQYAFVTKQTNNTLCYIEQIIVNSAGGGNSLFSALVVFGLLSTGEAIHRVVSSSGLPRTTEAWVYWNEPQDDEGISPMRDVWDSTA